VMDGRLEMGLIDVIDEHASQLGRRRRRERNVICLLALRWCDMVGLEEGDGEQIKA
ncbi:hypothetical protein EMPG_12188, partial [Blastomyces silverae]